MTPPVPKELSTELAVWNAALVRRFGASVETPTGPIIDTDGSRFAHTCWTLWELGGATATKRAEFLSAIGGLIDRTLRLPGCSACRLVADCDDADRYFLISEWLCRADFASFTRSRELYVLCGMRGLLSAEPYVVVDEVRKRTEGPMLSQLAREVGRHTS